MTELSLRAVVVALVAGSAWLELPAVAQLLRPVRALTPTVVAAPIRWLVELRALVTRQVLEQPEPKVSAVRVALVRLLVVVAEAVATSVVAAEEPMAYLREPTVPVVAVARLLPVRITQKQSLTRSAFDRATVRQ